MKTMANTAPRPNSVIGAIRRYGLLGGCLLVMAMQAGCAARTISIYQDPYINTAAQANRAPADRTGEPLELAIVCVYPDDLKNPQNELLRPTSSITSRDWFERRPQLGMENQSAFDLPKDRVYVMTIADDVYGRKIGSALRGAKLDGEAPIQKKAIEFDSFKLRDSDSVIYVFGKFLDSAGNYLPVPPAKYNPPGAYIHKLSVKIGVDADRPLEEAQYIRVLNDR